MYWRLNSMQQHIDYTVIIEFIVGIISSECEISLSCILRLHCVCLNNGPHQKLRYKKMVFQSNFYKECPRYKYYSNGGKFKKGF